jgi:PmbA protein
MKTLMENVISELLSKRVEGDLIFSTNKSLKMSAQKEMISDYKVSSSQILGLRVIKDGKVGISYTEAMDEEPLDSVISETTRMLYAKSSGLGNTGIKARFAKRP